MILFSLSLYQIAYAISVVALLAWTYWQDRSRFAEVAKQTFISAIIVYLISVAAASAQWDFKMGVVFRDLLVMSALGFIFRLLMRQRAWFLLGTLLLTGVFFGFFKIKVQPTFAAANLTSPLSLDEHGELLIEIQETASLDAIQNIVQRYELKVERAFFPANAGITNLDNYYVVDIPKNKINRLKKIANALSRTNAVVWVEENEVITVAPMESTTPRPVKKKFGINDPGVEQLWGFDVMAIDELYNYLNSNNIKPQRKALIAILDTGVDGQHEDLRDNFKSLNHQYDTDPVGHGTHCAGIAGAVSNNGIGVASFSIHNNFVQITSIRVLNSMGSGTQRTIINGMIEAADKGADVLSMSLGGFSDRFKIKAYTDAVKYVSKAGGIVVAAAGNSNRNAKDYAPVNTPGVIGVSAIDAELNRAVFSNTVHELPMGIAAPGVNVYSTIPNNKYNAFNGTSMATPYVAGLVGLLKSLQPDLTTKQVHDILHRTGKDTRNTKETGKLIQPTAAIKALD